MDDSINIRIKASRYLAVLHPVSFGFSKTLLLFAKMYHPAKLVAIFLFVQKMASAQVDLGSMESWGFNGVSSDDITLMSEKKMMIKNLEYTGEGPAAWFMVGKEEDDYTKEFTDLDGVIIPDENGGCDRLGRYRGDDIELTLPGNMKFTDYDYLSIYCIRFSHNFGYVPIKKGITFAQPVVANATVPAGNAAAAVGAAVTAAPQADNVEDDVPAECDQEPERRGGSPGVEEEEEDE
ncbi:uncharacterized protein LOC110862158 [Folsomia candida]|uniref:uncharacterized protein LOC110862158 n=1 Tax=Folsomia candida TaxID=158441 RepID=UPI001604BC6D|nr:uncharacterized protein LOC110862158 [Folsomia candida]